MRIVPTSSVLPQAEAVADDDDEWLARNKA